MPETVALPVVTVTPTIMSGIVVRWYASLDAAERGDEAINASRDGVMVHDFLHRVPADVTGTANQVFLTLSSRASDVDWVRSLATHRPATLLGPLVAIERAEAVNHG